MNHVHTAMERVDTATTEWTLSLRPHTGADGNVLLPETKQWRKPVPLPDRLPPVRPFEYDLLPEALRDWVCDIAERMQCPPDFVAVAVVVALSSVIGARAVVAPKKFDDWRVVPNLWGLIVGRPGVMKSPALAEVLKQLKRLEADEREHWQDDYETWKIKHKVFELGCKQAERNAASLALKDKQAAREALMDTGQEPEPPTMRRYVVNDSTVEALADLLTTHPWGLLVYRDEMHGLLASMDRQGEENTRTFYLTGADGNQGYAVDRIMRGHSHVLRVCLAMLGGIQPGKLQSYVQDAVSGGAGDDGLLQRFGLAVWPDIKDKFQIVDRCPDAKAKNTALGVFERLSRLQPHDEDTPQEWRFSEDAQKLFYRWWVGHEELIRSEHTHPAMASHLAKWRKLVPALALIFALVDTPDSEHLIHEEELARALDWTEYLLGHAERIYAAATAPKIGSAHTLLAKIKAGKLTDRDGKVKTDFTAREVAQKHWAGLTTSDEVRDAVALLIECGWLQAEEYSGGARGGRSSTRYFIHPEALSEVKS